MLLSFHAPNDFLRKLPSERYLRLTGLENNPLFSSPVYLKQPLLEEVQGLMLFNTFWCLRLPQAALLAQFAF